VSREVGRIQSGLEIAEAQIPQATDLDGWITTGVEVRDSLSELARLLQDAQFVGYVIERRQRQLLIVASQILGSMTGDAYGFASDFEIVDRSTNQPRPTRTLSCGETFLASLALALALVEIAARWAPSWMRFSWTRASVPWTRTRWTRRYLRSSSRPAADDW